MNNLIRHWARLIRESEENGGPKISLNELIELLQGHQDIPFVVKTQNETIPASDKVMYRDGILFLTGGTGGTFTCGDVLNSILDVVDADGTDDISVMFRERNGNEKDILGFTEGEESFYMEVGS